LNSSIRQRILTLTKARPDVLSNYNLLIVSYWIVYDKVNRLADIRKATPAESIRREFQKLAEEGTIQVPRRMQKEQQENVRGFQSELTALS
jgi:hypothetical protein